MLTRYIKATDALLDADFAAAEPFGNIKLGREAVFCRRLLRWSYVPVSSIKRVWRRIEEAKGRTGCCSNDFSSHFLMFETEDGVEKLKIGEEMYRHEPEALMERIAAMHPGIAVGKPE